MDYNDLETEKIEKTNSNMINLDTVVPIKNINNKSTSKVVNNNWSTKKEQLLELWKEECTLYSSLYSYNVVWYEQLDTLLSVTSILLSTVTGASLFNQTDARDGEAKTNYIIFGTLSILSAATQGIREYLGLKQKINMNLIASRQNKLIAMEISSQLTLSRSERKSGKDFLIYVRDKKTDMIMRGPVISNRAWKKILKPKLDTSLIGNDYFTIQTNLNNSNNNINHNYQNKDKENNINNSDNSDNKDNSNNKDNIDNKVNIDNENDNNVFNNSNYNKDFRNLDNQNEIIKLSENNNSSQINKLDKIYKHRDSNFNIENINDYNNYVSPNHQHYNNYVSPNHQHYNNDRFISFNNKDQILNQQQKENQDYLDNKLYQDYLKQQQQLHDVNLDDQQRRHSIQQQNFDYQQQNVNLNNNSSNKINKDNNIKTDLNNIKSNYELNNKRYNNENNNMFIENKNLRYNDSINNEKNNIINYNAKHRNNNIPNQSIIDGLISNNDTDNSTSSQYSYDYKIPSDQVIKYNYNLIDRNYNISSNSVISKGSSDYRNINDLYINNNIKSNLSDFSNNSNETISHEINNLLCSQNHVNGLDIANVNKNLYDNSNNNNFKDFKDIENFENNNKNIELSNDTDEINDMESDEDSEFCNKMEKTNIASMMIKYKINKSKQ